MCLRFSVFLSMSYLGVFVLFAFFCSKVWCALWLFCGEATSWTGPNSKLLHLHRPAHREAACHWPFQVTGQLGEPKTEVFERAGITGFKLRGGSSDPNQEVNRRRCLSGPARRSKVVSQVETPPASVQSLINEPMWKVDAPKDAGDR